MSVSNKPSVSSRSSKTQNVSWTPEMTRVILDCVDAAAGNNSIFITDRNTAMQQALTSLRPVTDPSMYNLLNKDKIVNKLSKQAILGGCASLPELFQSGTQCLDLAKLQTGTYTASEIHAVSKPQLNERKSSSRKNEQTAGKRPMTSSSNQNATKATKLNDERTRDERSNKRVKLSHPTDSLRDRGPSQISTRSRRKATNTTTYAEGSEISDSQDSDDEVHGPTQDPKAQVDSNSSLRSQNISVFVCEICDDTFQVKDLLMSHKLSHEQPASRKNTAQPSIELSSVNRRTQDTPEEFAILRLAKSPRGEHTDVTGIRKDMTSIQADIYDATKIFLMHSNIDGNEDILLQIRSYEDSLNELLSTIFGSGSIVHQIQSDEPSSSLVLKMGRCEIILSTIGAAITDWALQPLPQGEVRGGVLEEMNDLLRDRSPVFQDKVMEMAISQYLEKRVKPLVHEYAQVLAQDLFHLLRHFLPDELQPSRSQWLTSSLENQVIHSSEQGTSESGSDSPDLATVSFEPPHGDETHTSPNSSLNIGQRNGQKEKAQTEATSEDEGSRGQPSISEITSSELPHVSPQHTNGSPKWPPKPRHHPQRVFLDSLQGAFKSALNLRLQMEIDGNAKYSFHFPLSGRALALNSQVICNKANNKMIREPGLEREEASASEARKKVLVGLTPSVEGIFRAGHRGEGWKTDRVVLSKGCVHICDT